MPMLTAASDLSEQRPQEWHDLPQRLRELCEAAYGLRFAHDQLDDCGSVSRREGRHDDAHDLRSPEQAAYLAWQAAELAYQLIMARRALAPVSDIDRTPDRCRSCGRKWADTPTAEIVVPGAGDWAHKAICGQCYDEAYPDLDDDAETGAITISDRDQCPDCNGHGRDYDHYGEDGVFGRPCATCGGDGLTDAGRQSESERKRRANFAAVALAKPEPAPEIDDPAEQLARVAHLPRPAGVSFGPIDPDFF